ncbi:MAG: hypothetical protein VZS44_08040 [Bacilli bacterium]|nr:hypothetical protein [Bacilli bacterium]
MEHSIKDKLISYIENIEISTYMDNIYGFIDDNPYCYIKLPSTFENAIKDELSASELDIKDYEGMFMYIEYYTDINSFYIGVTDKDDTDNIKDLINDFILDNISKAFAQKFEIDIVNPKIED